MSSIRNLSVYELEIIFDLLIAPPGDLRNLYFTGDKVMREKIDKTRVVKRGYFTDIIGKGVALDFILAGTKVDFKPKQTELGIALSKGFGEMASNAVAKLGLSEYFREYPKLFLEGDKKEWYPGSGIDPKNIHSVKIALGSGKLSELSDFVNKFENIQNLILNVGFPVKNDSMHFPATIVMLQFVGMDSKFIPLLPPSLIKLILSSMRTTSPLEITNFSHLTSLESIKVGSAEKTSTIIPSSITDLSLGNIELHDLLRWNPTLRSFSSNFKSFYVQNIFYQGGQLSISGRAPPNLHEMFPNSTSMYLDGFDYGEIKKLDFGTNFSALTSLEIVSRDIMGLTTEDVRTNSGLVFNKECKMLKLPPSLTKLECNFGLEQVPTGLIELSCNYIVNGIVSATLKRLTIFKSLGMHWNDVLKNCDPNFMDYISITIIASQFGPKRKFLYDREESTLAVTGSFHLWNSSTKLKRLMSDDIATIKMHPNLEEIQYIGRESRDFIVLDLNFFPNLKSFVQIGCAKVEIEGIPDSLHTLDCYSVGFTNCGNLQKVYTQFPSDAGKDYKLLLKLSKLYVEWERNPTNTRDLSEIDVDMQVLPDQLEHYYKKYRTFMPCILRSTISTTKFCRELSGAFRKGFDINLPIIYEHVKGSNPIVFQIEDEEGEVNGNIPEATN